MSDSLKLFGWLFVASFFIALFRLRAGPLYILLLVTPTFALFQLLWASNILKTKPVTHWLFKIPGVLWLRGALAFALALPLWVRPLVVLGCIFGGLGLAKLFA